MNFHTFFRLRVCIASAKNMQVAEGSSAPALEHFPFYELGLLILPGHSLGGEGVGGSTQHVTWAVYSAPISQSFLPPTSSSLSFPIPCPFVRTFGSGMSSTYSSDTTALQVLMPAVVRS